MEKSPIQPDLSRFDLSVDHTAGFQWKNSFENIYSSFLLYIRINKNLPSGCMYRKIDGVALLDYLKKNIPFNPRNLIEIYSYKDTYQTNNNYEFFAFFFAPDFVIIKDINDDDISLYYDHTRYDEAFIQSFNPFFFSFDASTLKDIPESTSRFYVITKEGFSLGLKEYEFKAPEIDFSLNYNDDFENTRTQIEERLNSSGHGIFMLYGKPGTGKTTYIRYLASKINKRFIFVPNNIAENLTNINIIELLIKYPDSVLIVEDGEFMLQHGNAKTFTMSSLLNVTDGLLSDFLKIKIIFTFNTEIRKINEALLRKGRLACMYHFLPLKKDKAQKLSEHLGFTSQIHEDMSLSDIYNQNERDFMISKKRIGF